MIAAERQDRPNMPKDWCPFCPGSGGVPDAYDVHLYPNDFPILKHPADSVSPPADVLYRTHPAGGFCDVVLYSPDHKASLSTLPQRNLSRLFALWSARLEALHAIPVIWYVFIFENRGAEIGVTMPHPHGQIYSFPFIPPRMQRELDAARTYRIVHQACLSCEILRRECRDGVRMVFASDQWVAFVPFFAQYPYEVHPYPRRHLGLLADLTPSESTAFMDCLQGIARAYDALFGFPLAYMMGMHQAPINRGDYTDLHFHVEFYPVHRRCYQLKYNAGCETGAGVHGNPSLPETF